MRVECGGTSRPPCRRASGISPVTPSTAPAGTSRQRPRPRRRSLEKKGAGQGEVGGQGRAGRRRLGAGGPLEPVRLRGADGADAVGQHLVTAAAAKDCPTITVRPGQTAALPFGPPYKPVVTASQQFIPPGAAGKQAEKQLYLQLSLVGAGGEVCNNLLVNGGRPDGPAFTIHDSKDAIVQQGTFKYG